MKRILVFSRKDKLFDIDREFSKRDDVKNIDEKRILLFDELKNLFYPVDGLNENGLYLMYDLMKASFFNAAIQGVDQDEVLFLIHNDPKFLTGYKHVYEGSNETIESGGRVYPYVIAILQDELPDKFERIKTTIVQIDPLLEAKIQFIESAFAGETPKKLNKLLLPYEKEIQLFQKTRNEDVLSPGFFKAFEQLLKDLKIDE